MSDVFGPLISTEDLAALMDAGTVKIIDGSWHMPAAGRDPETEYENVHIPGSVRFDVDAISDKNSDLPHMLPPASLFAEAVGAIGISNTDTVVVYDTVGAFSSPRVWWTFRAMGHERVAVLDGGLPKWRAEGRPLSNKASSPEPASYTPRSRPELVRDAAAVLAQSGAGEALVLDARPLGRFLGETPEPRPGLRGGRIPGSRSLPASELLTGDGVFKSVGELSGLIKDAGVKPGQPVIASCGSGVSAASLCLALEHLGENPYAVYDGSWTEWGGRNDLPLETGPIETVPQEAGPRASADI